VESILCRARISFSFHSMPRSSPPQELSRRNLRLDCLLLLGIAILAAIEFSSFLSSGSFGSEFTQFFMFVHHRSFGDILRGYLQFDVGWYRPTQFLLPYWIGERFISWHNPDGWRAYELFTMLIVCALIYWFVLLLLPGRRIAAFASALYFTCVPVVYVPLYELFAFDFIHIIFGLLSVIAFLIGYRSGKWRGVGWTALAWFFYVVALTSKEVTIVIPVYLTILSAILYFYEPRVGGNKERFLREVKRLAPFWMMTVVYWVVHVRKIPPGSFSGSTDYRLSANWMLMLRNANKYPLWFARIHGYTLDVMNQAAGYQNLRNDVIGTAALLLVCYACFRLWRMGAEYRKYVLLGAAWIAVFLIVPVYSGGYFWHGNFALCGYCMLFGVSIDWLFTRIRGQAVHFALAAFLIAGIVGLTRTDAAECLISGIHSETYRINSTVLKQPPVPFNRVSGPALVYVEDRKEYGWWSYGAGTLFNIVYLNRDVHQVLVPVMNKVSRADRVRWLKDPNAFFFRYDDSYRWFDVTEQFRAFAIAKGDDRVVPPKITSLGPPETRAGVGFNVQSSGLSALGVAGSNFEPGSEILINGQKQPTAFGSTGWVTTIFPREAYSRPGNIIVQVRNPDGEDSNPYTFRVLQ
jgi:hypothetical protein